ncbi:FMN-binding protein [Enterovibrio sp. Hal110]
MILFTPSLFAQDWLEVSDEAQALFPRATRMKASQDAMPITDIYQLDQTIGYLFETDDLTDFPGFSGDSINLRVGLDVQGRIVGLVLVRHHEPIFLHGLGEAPLYEFIAQYQGLSLKQQVLAGSDQARIASGDLAYFDGVTKATVSVMVVHDTILAAARKVAQARLNGFGSSAKATLNMQQFTPRSFDVLRNERALFRWQLSDDEAAEQLSVNTGRLLAARDARDEKHAFYRPIDRVTEPAKRWEKSSW